MWLMVIRCSAEMRATQQRSKIHSGGQCREWKKTQKVVRRWWREHRHTQEHKKGVSVPRSSLASTFSSAGGQRSCHEVKRSLVLPFPKNAQLCLTWVVAEMYNTMSEQRLFFANKGITEMLHSCLKCYKMRCTPVKRDRNNQHVLKFPSPLDFLELGFLES